MVRLLLLLHRYLGIAVGALMVMWCFSGVVMMYVGYPALSENSRIENLSPIEWGGCCKISADLLGDADPVGKFRVEMLAGRPTLYLLGRDKPRLIDLMTGSAIDGVSANQAAAVARAYLKETPTAPPRLLGLIDYDQWTVSGHFNSDRPLYLFQMNDALGTELYVSSTTGKAVQITRGRERFWNWLGAVPHWLYFTELRHHVWLWTQSVIVASLTGCFLAGTGIYIGVRQLIRRPAGRWSPYRGFSLWHHIAGLAFGILTLTWVCSGLLSMNPWGWLEGAGDQAEMARLRGGPGPLGAELRASLKAVTDAHPIGVSLEFAPLDGALYFIATGADGERRRLDTAAAPAPLGHADWAGIAKALNGPGAAPFPELMTREDEYYFSHHRDTVALPAYRVVLGDGSDTRYYIDPVSGALLAKIDRGAQRYRWWHQGFHRMDFTVALRDRPQWDALLWLLMSGVTTVCVTGAYLGCRRLVRA